MARCCWVNLGDGGEEGVQRKLPKFGFVRLRAGRFKVRWVRLNAIKALRGALDPPLPFPGQFLGFQGDFFPLFLKYSLWPL